MTDFVNILKGQIEEGRKSSRLSNRDAPTPRQSVQKKKLVPLEEPEMNEMEIQVESKVQNKNAPVKYADMETSPDENIHDDQNSSRITEPDNTEAQEVEEPKQTGGALWSAPKELEDIRSSMKELPHPPPEEKNEKKGPSLFDLVMEPPKKELQPTLFTYFDKLMSMGEV